MLNRKYPVHLGGTANLAVPSANLPPSLGLPVRSLVHETAAPHAAGLVARQNGPVARSTQPSTESLARNKNSTFEMPVVSTFAVHHTTTTSFASVPIPLI